MAQTGMERSLTVIISKTIGGIIQQGYPVTYQGRSAFTLSEVIYPAITLDQMVSMSVEDYNARLTAFKAYVESRESGLSLSTDLVEGYEAYKENLTACPID